MMYIWKSCAETFLKKARTNAEDLGIQKQHHLGILTVSTLIKGLNKLSASCLNAKFLYFDSLLTAVLLMFQPCHFDVLLEIFSRFRAIFLTCLFTCAAKSSGPTPERSVSDSDPFYSTFHNTPERRKFSKEEWDKFTRETTKNALEGLVSSPDFSRWAVAHADRITLTPSKDSAKQPRRWFPWS